MAMELPPVVVDTMLNEGHKGEDGNAALRALLRFMEARNLKAGPLSKRAGFAPSAIYNLIAGRARAPSAALLQKIADAEGVSIADIMAYANEAERIAVHNVVVSGGRLMVSNAVVTVMRPMTIDPAIEVDAAVVSDDGLHPIPPGWAVVFSARPAPPEQLIGQICVIRAVGNKDAFVGTLRAGRTPNSFDVEPWHGPLQQGLTIMAAHRVVTFQPPDA